MEFSNVAPRNALLPPPNFRNAERFPKLESKVETQRYRTITPSWRGLSVRSASRILVQVIHR